MRPIAAFTTGLVVGAVGSISALFVLLADREPLQPDVDDDRGPIPPVDPYLEELLALATGQHRSEGGALLRPDMARRLLEDELRWRAGDFPIQRAFRSFRASDAPR